MEFHRETKGALVAPFFTCAIPIAWKTYGLVLADFRMHATDAWNN